VKVRVGIDIACRAAHQAACADQTGKIVWSGQRFHTRAAELEALWARLPGDATEVMVVMEPTRNAWVPLAAWFRRRGATVVLVPLRAVRRPACLRRQARQDRPAGCRTAGPSGAAAPRRPAFRDRQRAG
jgi:transposase